MQREGWLPVKPKAAPMETRDIAAVLIGLEAGLAVGLLAFGTTLFAPMGIAVRRGRLQLIRRALRAQLRGVR